MVSLHWSESDKVTLEKIQKRAVNMVSVYSATYEDKLKELNPQSLEDLRVRFIMIQVFKIMNYHDTEIHIISKIAGLLNPKILLHSASDFLVG